MDSLRTQTGLLLVAVVAASLLFVSSLAKLQHFKQPLKPDGSLTFLVVGDWGRRGLYNQSEVAHQMGIVGEQMDIDFVISTGDNFYDNGLTGVNDPAFFESFTDIYTAPSLQKQWYTVLGNHDYRGNSTAQLDPILTQKDGRWLCQRSFLVNAEIVDFFFVDTSPFINDYFINPEHVYHWHGVTPRMKYLTRLLKDLDLELRSSPAKWKFVIGHHPIFSAGHHGNTKDLIKHLVPTLKAHNIDAYINGHDHCVEHISGKDGKIQYLTSGGGSKAWRGDKHKWSTDRLKFYHDGQGFMSVKMTENNARFAFYDVYGNVLHQLSMSKESYSAL